MNSLEEQGAVMTNLHSALSAAIRALHGESDIDVIYPAIGKPILAQVIALASNAYPVIRTVAALRSGLTALLDPPDIAEPALHDVVARLIGTNEMSPVLDSLAKIAPAGWGRNHAAILANAVQRRMCSSDTVAALIGPCDESAALLRKVSEVSSAIQLWGKSSPNAPTTWMHAISADERDRLIATIRREPCAVACCIPWLPSDRMNHSRVEDMMSAALDAFAEASPTARAQHDEFLRFLIMCAQPSDLGALTRLACEMDTKEVWSRVQRLIRISPDNAYRVVAAAPWDDLDATARAVILECADHSDICAAVAAARGQEMVERITDKSAAAFFAALDPQVWDALPFAERLRWRDALHEAHGHLAVRSLGPRPEFLERARLDNDLVCAVRRHTPDAAALRWTLLPIALRMPPPDAAHALIAALPTPPPDPGAFFTIAGGHADSSSIAPAQATLHTPADLACAVVLQRCTDPNLSIHDFCATLHTMLYGRTWEDLAPIMALLDDNARAILAPDPDALIERLAHPDHKEALRQALDRLATLPPEVAVPTVVALNRRNPETMKAADMIADTLHAHGDVFLTLTEAIGDEDLRTALLPLPHPPAAADALRAVVRVDVSNGRRLAIALRFGDQHTTLHALQTIHPQHAVAVWSTMDDAMRHAIANQIAAAWDANDQTCITEPIVASIRISWRTLQPKTQQALSTLPAFSDLPLTHERPAARIPGRRR